MFPKIIQAPCVSLLRPARHNFGSQRQRVHIRCTSVTHLGGQRNNLLLLIQTICLWVKTRRPWKTRLADTQDLALPMQAMLGCCTPGLKGYQQKRMTVENGDSCFKRIPGDLG